ncbi:MAG: D-alanyl-D-alanine carboxypeptidase/D-alanyl-D-alanine-endopeptidase [Rhodobacteraceae bacterium]|nr:MAG: D-alanyl-D-alanine carboxypeptidase/D-alanyl-D-alanine-endopeptidase [Paracoccaceae bacterium]
MVYLPTRRHFLSALGAFGLGGPALAGAPQVSLRPQARGVAQAPVAPPGPEALVAAAGLSGQVAFALADVRSGAMLEALGGGLRLPPASVAKAITALYALDTLGAEHRFETRLLARGAVSNGILRGDLILSGGGDPTLSTDHLAALARGLKQAGVREVQGDFIVHEGLLPQIGSIDPDQPDHVGYSPAISGIALNFNRVHFEWKRAGNGYSVTIDARSDTLRPEVGTARMRIVARDLPVYTYASENGVDAWTVAAGALGKGGARWLPVRNPGAYAGDVFRTLARAQGIVLKAAKVTRGDGPGGTVLANHFSDPLRMILRDMLHFSTNITAEMVGLSATRARGGKVQSLKASADAMNAWARAQLGMQSVALVDHSGLGDASRMTPQDLVSALVQVRRGGILRPLLKPVALRDERGRIIQNHPIKVDAKTGTLNFVSGLGGYMTTAGGREMAFAIFTADIDQRARIKRQDRETPQGARSWNGRSRKLQQALIERWGSVYRG